MRNFKLPVFELMGEGDSQQRENPNWFIIVPLPPAVFSVIDFTRLDP